MKVVLLVPRFSGGGAEFVARQWALHLAASGDTVVVAATKLTGDDDIPAELRLVALDGRGTVRKLLQLRRLLRTEKPDAVLALMPYWNLLALFATRLLPGRPRVLISGRNMAVHLRRTFGPAYAAKQLLARLAYRWADEFVAISHPVAAEAIALYGLPPASVSVVLNPSLKTESAAAVAPRHDDGPLALVAPARLVAQKRPQLVVETAVACRELHGREVVAHFYGVGPLTEQVRALAAKRGVPAVFHGWVSSWSADLPANAVVLLPSLSEGFGNVLVEAARVGVPSVASSQALGVADAIVPRLTGVLVAGESAADFAAGVIEAAGMTVAGHESWLSSFTRASSGAALRSRLEAVVMQK
ncbi:MULTISPECIES: glycosyltransferase [unclassified Rathayibacter]|uniref:glycosyltransferase n=1 Tax=unclassified Rathayibacter TaxID=2609250 RepID=UPI001FB2773C|nr:MULTISPECIES: glycosyltransferase [unclassified Rathayibacter]MCJ1682409.1 glycosyltransferase [Rathayibacter sp. VKM Ac-2928]MCJ1705386.1 glycosyltransferase [Rathayibacter sp. VKM Ac-2926]